MDTWSTTNTASTIDVTINPTSCDCSALAWTAPTISSETVNIDASSPLTVPVPGSDTSATATVPAFANCYELSGCVTTGSYVAQSDFEIDDGTGAVSLSGNTWITWDAST